MAGDGARSEDELQLTLTPVVKENSQENNLAIVEKDLPWGRLIGYRTYVKSVDLIKTFTYGRGLNCSVTISKAIYPVDVLKEISREHFQIEYFPKDNIAYITDLSKNNTYVNNKLLGKGKRKILNHRDIIAISAPSRAIYMFVYMNNNCHDNKLPMELVDRFAPIKELGRGSCGQVFLVKDRDNFKEYAIKKIILAENNTLEQNKINHPSKVFNEIEILKRISHPCIIQLLECFLKEKEVYLVLEYMRGGELTRQIALGMPEDLAKFYFCQMILAIRYLHSKGIIHRDLKPENILLLDDNDETLLKIADFGLSRIVDCNDAKTVCGTPQYIAPEVISRKKYGKEADLWSLGVILYYMISNKLPFNGKDFDDIICNIRLCNYDLATGIWAQNDKRPVKDLIYKMLQIVPNDRIELLEIIQHDWIRNDDCVKYRLCKQLIKEGLENPFRDILIEQSSKKFRFNSFESSSLRSPCQQQPVQAIRKRSPGEPVHGYSY